MEQHNTHNGFFLQCTDYAVSGEAFDLCYDFSEHMLATTPQPKIAALSKYYNSSSYISHAKHRKSIFDSVYFSVRKLAIKRKLKWVSSCYCEGASILDFGAGVGHFVRSAQAKGWVSMGLETNQKARNIANSKNPATVFNTNHIESIKPQSQSAITLWHVLEHLPDYKQQLNKLKTLLKPSGRLFIAVPNFRSYDAAYFQQHWAAYDVPRHLWHFSKKAMVSIFDELDMEIERTHPMIFDAFYVSLLSTKYQSGRYKLFKALWVGFLSNLKATKTGEYSSLVFVVKHKNN